MLINNIEIRCYYTEYVASHYNNTSHAIRGIQNVCFREAEKNPVLLCFCLHIVFKFN